MVSPHRPFHIMSSCVPDFTFFSEVTKSAEIHMAPSP